MRIGSPKEIKVHEYRVGLVPASVAELTAAGHEVLIETGAGAGIGMEDAAYVAAGAAIVPDAAAVFAGADLVVKVKEPQAGEIAMLRGGQTLFTYLHLAPDPDQARGLMDSGATAIAYETVTDAHGGLPLLAPMSEVAGRMAAQVGAHFLEKAQGGAGILLGGVPGVAPGRVTVLGAGAVGREAARMAIGLGADVTILNRGVDKLAALNLVFGASLKTLQSNAHVIEETVAAADLVIGAVLVPGGAAPKLVSRELVARMRPGSVVVDVAIDQGGCFETSRPTTHADPVYVEDGVIHYCVTNMPGAVPRTSAFALNNATLPFTKAMAAKGVAAALADDPHLLAGLNVMAGAITNAAVAESLGLDLTPAAAALG
ncbi:MAG: alanine dehydrogenase [Alphaproteobacteria bacterium]|nr:alanine dehydrogenase [Alphaproteobacteria bacterium]